MQIANKTVVSIHYTLTDPDGDVLDSSRGAEPLAYLHGSRNIISGLESALAGKAKGDTLKVTIPPEEAYGVRDDTLVAEVPRAQFEGTDVAVGQQFHTEGPHGKAVVTVTKVDSDQVTVDGNHPLAGVSLTFDVEIVEVRAATPVELAHGHVHGPGGHHH
jgi:FKBP-type peptidyl-prolyl cis-trans isomerase SlyD